MRFLIVAAAVALMSANVGCQSTGCGSGGGCCPLGSQPACGCSDCGCCEGGCCGDCGSCGCGDCCGCQECGGQGCPLCNALGGGPGDPSLCPCGPGDSVYDFQPGPPVGQVAYPYYTTKGPGDFLSPCGGVRNHGYINIR